MDLACSGRVIDAEEALRIGLVSRIVEEATDPSNGQRSDDTDGIGAVAEELTGVDPAALRTVKRRLRDDADRATKEERAVEAFGELFASREGSAERRRG